MIKMNNNVSQCLFNDEDALNQALLSTISQQLSQNIEHNCAATLLVSGGSTPKKLYQSLSQQKLNWEKISIAMVDERWVDNDHEKSNQAFIAQTLIQNKAQLAPFTRMIDPKQSVEKQNLQQAANRLDPIYAQLPKKPITILGMGNDGHTASFFPEAKGLAEALTSKYKYCCAINARTSATTGEQTERLTVSLNYLLSSQHVYLLIKGQEKRDVLRQAQACSEIEKMPVSAILNQTTTPVTVYWCP